MFPFQPNDELVFGSQTTSQVDYQIFKDLIMDHNCSLMENNTISFSTSSKDKQQHQKPDPRLAKGQSKRGDEYQIMHREVERKRRQQMSNLFVSLRSSLPLQPNNKGKSSVCDEIGRAADYIKQMQKKIEELSIRRDKLKKLSNSCDEKAEIANGSDNLVDSVMVNQITDGVEILISRSIGSSEHEGVSRILAKLLERELDVVSCLSTRTNGGFVHKIQVQARDISSLQVSMLQDILTKAIK